MNAKTDIVLLHNPDCSKSRQAKAILEEAETAYVERRYLDSPLSEQELIELKSMLGRPVREWVRMKDKRFEEAGLTEDASEAELIVALSKEPALMERPILIRGGKAIVGRPPEAILELT